MTSKEIWNQYVLQRVIEAIKVTLPATEKLEEEEEQLTELLSAEAQKRFEEFRYMQDRHENDNQVLCYQRGFLDGIRLAHKALQE